MLSVALQPGAGAEVVVFALFKMVPPRHYLKATNQECFDLKDLICLGFLK